MNIAYFKFRVNCVFFLCFKNVVTLNNENQFCELPCSGVVDFQCFIIS